MTYTLCAWSGVFDAWPVNLRCWQEGYRQRTSASKLQHFDSRNERLESHVAGQQKALVVDALMVIVAMILCMQALTLSTNLTSTERMKPDVGNAARFGEPFTSRTMQHIKAANQLTSSPGMTQLALADDAPVARLKPVCRSTVCKASRSSARESASDKPQCTWQTARCWQVPLTSVPRSLL